MNKIIALIIVALLFTGCATPYQENSGSIRGGFADKQLSRNEFIVGFSGNGYTSGQRAIDLCMLRSADLTLSHGFHYFILTANNAAYDLSTSVTVGDFVPTGNGGGVYLSSTQTIPKPSASNRILCFREKPAWAGQYYDAQQVFDELSKQYGAQHNGGDQIFEPAESTTTSSPELRFHRTSDITYSQAISAKDVIVIEDSNTLITEFPVAVYIDYENPFGSKDELRRYLVKTAIDNDVNGVLILDSTEQVKSYYPNADQRIGFVCQLLIVPKARLGIEYETGSGYEKRCVIRRIENPEATASGLLIGDNVLAVNGIDVILNSSEATRDCMKWNAGQEVQVTVARNGKEMTFPVKTVENRP